jgi:hypothetical protein
MPRDPGYRRDEFAGLLGLLSLRLEGQVPDGPHVVQAVGDLDLQRAPVGLLQAGAMGMSVEAGVVEEEVGDDVAELRAQLAGRLWGFGGGNVVQYRGDHGFCCRVLFGEDERDLDGVGDVLVTAAALFVSVCLLGDDQGTTDGVQYVGSVCACPVEESQGGCGHVEYPAFLPNGDKRRCRRPRIARCSACSTAARARSAPSLVSR